MVAASGKAHGIFVFEVEKERKQERIGLLHIPWKTF